MIQLGNYNTLRIVKRVDFGLYLDGGEAGEILLPTRYVPEGAEIGQDIEVFLYLDIDERLVATTLHPLARVGEFAFLRVAWVNQYGAFLDWGLMKDLFCPFREQKMRMEKDHSYIVHVHIDEDSYRIVASAKVERYLRDDRPAYRPGDRVQLLVQQKTDLGFKVIVDGAWRGMVYEDQVFRELHTGDRTEGYVANVRPDNRLDITLQPTGHQHDLDFSQTLLDYLREHGGVCHLGDKSDADDIRQMFQVSKKVFKRAVGDLYRQRLVSVADLCVKLNE